MCSDRPAEFSEVRRAEENPTGLLNTNCTTAVIIQNLRIFRTSCDPPFRSYRQKERKNLQNYYEGLYITGQFRFYGSPSRIKSFHTEQEFKFEYGLTCSSPNVIYIN